MFLNKIAQKSALKFIEYVPNSENYEQFLILFDFIQKII